MGYASRLRKTHNVVFELQRLYYPWHRWYEREIQTRKATGPYSAHTLWCRLSDDAPDEVLIALPCWMFDATACATMRIAANPSVDCGALRSVQGLIRHANTGVSSKMLQHQPCQSEDHGDADAHESPHSISNKSAQTVLRTGSPTAVEEPPGARPRRGNQESGASFVQRSRRTLKQRSSKPRRAR
jgi:hypothetical protein